MNPQLILGLITDLYAQVTSLTQENTELRAALAAQNPPPEGATDDR